MDSTVLVVGFILLMIALIVFGYIRQEKTHKLWQAFAQSRQWQYFRNDRTVFGGLELNPFGRGSSRRANHLLLGRWAGLPVRIFHYRYDTGSGKNRSTTYRSVVQFSSNAKWPPLEIYNGWRLRLTKDIQFESENFNEQFDVRGPDERFAFDIVHPRFMTALLDGALFDTNLSIENGVFTLWRSGWFKPEEVDPMLQQLVTILELVPDHVWHNGQVRAPAINQG